MKVPISWLTDFVDIDLPLADLAHRLTMAGLEVEEIQYVGLPKPEDDHLQRETRISGLAWDPEKIVVGAILEVLPHPNADRLVLCRMDDGHREHTLVTGAPNLFPYKGQGLLEHPLKVAYAREGATLYDGHKAGQETMTLKRARIRGVESYSMACSEKELGISDDHEGVIILDDDAPVGTPLVDYMGDAVLDIALTPNIARNASLLGVAREVAALTGQALRHPTLDLVSAGPPIEGRVFIEIQNPELNPRFVLGLIAGVEIKASPYWVQRRLRLAGMRPINTIVDATNYAMLEIGEPLHAFDYDALVKRAGGGPPTIITRTAHADERLTTLDGIERQLDDFTVLVCDIAGALSIAGVMGGAETEVNPQTRNVLLEGAAWNFINVRRTMVAQRLSSEAAYRFSRGVHPAQADRGVKRGLALMRQWAGGVVSQGLVDNYPLPPSDPTVNITPGDAKRWLGLELSPSEMAQILRDLDFMVEVDGDIVHTTTPDHRLDISTGIVGVADLMEEVARVYGYDRIPETRLADALPPQRTNVILVREEQVRDALVNLGLQEVMTYRMTSPKREKRHLPPDTPWEEEDYVRITNPISSDRVVLRKTVLAGLLEVVERNARLQKRMAFFEIGPVYRWTDQEDLPEETARLTLVMTGPRQPVTWQGEASEPLDFYDLKGVITALTKAIGIPGVSYQPGDHPSCHPGKTASILMSTKIIGQLGELHPLVSENYDLPETSLLIADFDLEALLQSIPERFTVDEVPTYPPVIEDLAVVVDVDIPAERLRQAILQAGGEIIHQVSLFDLYQGEQLEAGKKSLAYRLTYQAPDRTLTDQEVAKVRQRIIQQLNKELSATLRS